MAYDNSTQQGNGQSNNFDRNNETIFSKRVKAGKRRTYFFDVRATRGNDYFITITESKKRFEDGGYDRHKMFLYKEDFNKFLAGLTDTINYVKTDLMPNFDFDAFSHENDEEYVPNTSGSDYSEMPTAPVTEHVAIAHEEPMVSAIEERNDSTTIDDWKI